MIDLAAVKAAGCTFVADGNFDALRSPIGDDAWARRYTLTRAGETHDLFQALAALPHTHAAYTLAKYQLGRLSYTLRAAPRAQCQPAIEAYDRCARALIQGWLANFYGLPAAIGGSAIMMLGFWIWALFVYPRMSGELERGGTV